MNCENILDIIQLRASESIGEDEIRKYMEHIAKCGDCRSALRGADALRLLKNRPHGEVPDDLFGELTTAAIKKTAPEKTKYRGFWLGTSVGGMVAATFFALALNLGWFDSSTISEPIGESHGAEFIVALYEPRQMSIAIETDRPLAGASISIVLSGDVEIRGFTGQREMTWDEDLDAGLNRLSLPIYATGVAGGQIVVRLDHPLSEKVFVINLRTVT